MQTVLEMNFELLSPPRYGNTKLHVGIAGGEEFSLCGRLTANWIIATVTYDILRVTCPICRKRAVEMTCSDKGSTDGGGVVVAVVGSRTFAPLRLVRDYVAKLPVDAHVVSGGARGVDEVAARAAIARGLKVTVLKADWERYGKRAGMLRNTQVVEMLAPGRDRLVAFWDQSSDGTGNVIKQAKMRGVQIVLHREDGTSGEYFYDR